MKLNKKGFTLVELLAAMVILAAIMVIAVPNVMGILNNSRANAYVEDAKKLISLAEYKFRSDNTSVKRPDKGGHCIVMTLGYLDNSELENAPNNGAYDKEKSFVIIKNAGVSGGKNEYVYYVQIVENLEKGGGTRGIPIKSYGDLYGEEAKNLVKNSISTSPNNVSGMATYCPGGRDGYYNISS